MQLFNSIEVPSKLMSYVEKDSLNHDVRKLRDSFGVLPDAVVYPAFVVVSGLPGTGKSFILSQAGGKDAILHLGERCTTQNSFSLACLQYCRKHAPFFGMS